jgi:predicted ABC-class ATPase
MALGDFLLRNLYNSCKRLGADASLGDGAGGGWQGPKGGDIQVLEPCQHVLEQSAVRIDRTNGNVIAQITINLPARGRTILGRAAEQILGSTLPTMIQQSFYYSNLPSKDELQKHVESVEDQVWLQRQLETRNLVAFVRNGAILPRISGDDDRPMDARQAVPFTSPKGGDSSNDRERQRMEVSFALPNAEITILGMGIPKGITLICGGGFHGKSTLLSVLQNGVYPKVVGDGREFCVVDPNACKIRAEDGRNVQAVDISNFINNLPYGKDTTDFSTMDASGSTSQAAFIQEVRY